LSCALLVSLGPLGLAVVPGPMGLGWMGLYALWLQLLTILDLFATNTLQ